MVYDLDNCPKIPLRNFTLKICLFGATNIVKASHKSKFVYSGYGIIFDAKGNWNFDNDSARNVTIFDVDDSSLSHTNNRKNNFLVLGEGNTLVLMEGLVHQRRSLVLILLKQRQSFT